MLAGAECADATVAFRPAPAALRVHAMVGGARGVFYARDVSVPTRSVGAQLRPGAAHALFGLPADALADHHTPLDALWGGAAASAIEQLHAAPTPALQLDRLEALLAARLRDAEPVHPALAQAVQQLDHGVRVVDVVQASGYSHRARVARFQRVLSAARTSPDLRWAALALDAGYSDQAHLGREFRATAGVTPQAWRDGAPSASSHLPMPR